jgi:hypothetical protein
MTKTQIKSTSRFIRWLLPVLPLVVAWLISGASARNEVDLGEGQDQLAEDAWARLDDDSRSCLDCHSKLRYDLENPDTGEVISMKMYDEIRIDPHVYLNSTHGHFTCVDCHSAEYEFHPHPIDAKFDFQYSCLDCHGAGAQFAEFNFHKIEEEFNVSVHGDHFIPDFTCWSCHNPHSYKVTTREGGRITDIVAHNNAMCLGCHGDISHYEVLIERQLTNMLSKHDWLPNQSLHFRKVRCIDCHAQVHEDILVAHHIVPAKEAVRNCVDCHSTNSILLASLYKHQIQERRNRLGFFNASITTEAYIIGANRNYFFNLISAIIFGMVLIGIAIHATLRYVNHRKRRS